MESNVVSSKASILNSFLLLSILGMVSYTLVEKHLIENCQSDAYLEGFAHGIVKYRISEFDCEYLTTANANATLDETANGQPQLQWLKKHEIAIEALVATAPRNF